MRNVFVVCMALSAALASAGCKKKAGDSADDAFAKMSGFKDSMCACKDKACADKVSADMTKWSEEMAKKNTGDKKPVTMSEADTKKYAEVTTKLGECTTKAMTAGMDTGSAAVVPAGSAAPTEGSAAAPAQPAVEMGDVKMMTIYQPEQNGSNNAAASLYSEKNGEELMLQIQDVRNRPYMIKEFETAPAGATKDTVAGYPAIFKDSDYGPEISVLVNKEGLIVQATTSRGAPKSDNERLKKVVEMFDLKGIEKQDMKKDEIDGKTLAKYFPKLAAHKN